MFQPGKISPPKLSSIPRLATSPVWIEKRGFSGSGVDTFCLRMSKAAKVKLTRSDKSALMPTSNCLPVSGSKVESSAFRLAAKDGLKEVV